MRGRTKRQRDSETDQKSTRKETERERNKIKKEERGGKKMAACSYICGVNQNRSQLKREKGEGAHKKTGRQ